MANTKQLPMHPDFARWLAAIEMGGDESRRLLRWTGVSAVVESPDNSDIETLIRLAFRSRQPAGIAQVEKFRQAFKKADATFEMVGNDRELQVLASVSLATLMSKGGNRGGEAALAITTASLDGARRPDLPMDLAVLADSAINQIAEINGKRPDLSAYTSVNAPKLDFQQAAEKVTAEPNWQGVAQAFTMAAEKARAAFAEVVRQQTNATSAMGNFLRVQDEELQMLWWLTGERSFDLDCTFDAVPDVVRPLVFGKELADSTQFLPGPASVKGMLSRAGLKERKKLKLSAAINAADETWLQQLIPDGELSPVSTPIHFGVQRRLETGAGDAWIAGWAAALGVPEGLTLSPLMLGLLFYRESVLLLSSR